MDTEHDCERTKLCLKWLENISTEKLKEWIEKGYKPASYDPKPYPAPVFPINPEDYE